MAVLLHRFRNRAEAVQSLRRLLPRLESVSAERPVFPLGRPEIDGRLPGSGLAANAVHEIIPLTDEDAAAAFGFAAALSCRLPTDGALLFIASPSRSANHARPFGPGVNALGLDPRRLILVETDSEKEALWAIEESLNSLAPVAVIGAINRELSLKASQRLQVAAGKSGLPLFLLRPAKALGSSAAATRWRVGGLAAVRDRFGLFARWRWRVALERCRNGRLGEWMVEYDHAAHRFSLAAPLADPEVSRERGEERFCGAGQS